MDKYAVLQDQELVKEASSAREKKRCKCDGIINSTGNTMLCSKGGTSCFEAK